jgi:hypothetical protein
VSRAAKFIWDIYGTRRFILIFRIVYGLTLHKSDARLESDEMELKADTNVGTQSRSISL